MPTEDELRDSLDTELASLDPLYADSSLRAQAKATMWQALGNVIAPELGGGGGGGAPTNADYLVKTANGSLSAERVVTDTASVVWDWATAGQAKATVPDATTSAKGLVELATNGETSSGVVVQGNDSRLNDSRAPSGSAGGDLAGTYPNPTVTQARGLRETAGPTTLAMGAVVDGEGLQRSGSNIVSRPFSATYVYDTAQSNTALTVPTWAVQCAIFCVGAGGGGGGGRGSAAGTNGGGAGGAGGAYQAWVGPCVGWPATIYVTVGAAGTGGAGASAGNGSSGTKGGDSWVTTLSTAVIGSTTRHICTSGLNSGGGGGQGGQAGASTGGTAGTIAVATQALYGGLGTRLSNPGDNGSNGGGTAGGTGRTVFVSDVVTNGGTGGGGSSSVGPSAGNGGTMTGAGQFSTVNGGTGSTVAAGTDGANGTLGEPWAATGGTGGGGSTAGNGGNGGVGGPGCGGGGGGGSTGFTGGNGGDGGDGYVIVVFT